MYRANAFRPLSLCDWIKLRAGKYQGYARSRTSFYFAAAQAVHTDIAKACRGAAEGVGPGLSGGTAPSNANVFGAEDAWALALFKPDFDGPLRRIEPQSRRLQPRHRALPLFEPEIVAKDSRPLFQAASQREMRKGREPLKRFPSLHSELGTIRAYATDLDDLHQRGAPAHKDLSSSIDFRRPLDGFGLSWANRAARSAFGRRTANPFSCFSIKISFLLMSFAPIILTFVVSNHGGETLRHLSGTLR